MAKISHKLATSLEGALAAGGDPATSPLYVFGPFLRLIVIAGVAKVTFGASIWLVVFTIVTVSAMYRMVMGWVTDGSGGSGLNEEEFGRWAVKINAAITFIEYTLTFLVSMAAMVTFIADRIPMLNEHFLGIQYRAFVAILLSVLTGWLVNRGPKTASRAFGPATAGVLVLLWMMIFATIWQLGFRLPDLNLAAFNLDHINLTFGGFARILAVMTGIEVFANLVAAYEGPPEVKSKKAFGSLAIIMGTTIVTMLVVGPAILELSDVTNEHVSVFTQTMDSLLPAPLAYLGTLIGIAVLLSASAASAQGLQNLALGLKDRNYVPAIIGQRNEFDVADMPVWIQVALVCLVFLMFGTSEETYLAIYAAGVFILLSMTGWAAAKRLIRETQLNFDFTKVGLIVGTVIAAALTSGATLIIFGERFMEGAWTYFLFIPILYGVFSYYRQRLGDPSPTVERLAQLEEATLGGFGMGQATMPVRMAPGLVPANVVTGREGIGRQERAQEKLIPRHALIPLDGSTFAEQALPLAELICTATGAELTILSTVSDGDSPDSGRISEERLQREGYLRQLDERLKGKGLKVDYSIRAGSVAESTRDLVRENGIDLIITSTRGGSGVRHWLSGGVARKIIQLVDKPVLLVQSSDVDDKKEVRIKKILVNLDGSRVAELVIPYARVLAKAFQCKVLLLSVPEIPEPEKYGAMADLVEEMRTKAETEICQYLESIASTLAEEGIEVQATVTGSFPARTINAVAEVEDVDLIMMTTRGRGGLDRILMGSVAQRVVQITQRPVFLLPVDREIWAAEEKSDETKVELVEG